MFIKKFTPKSALYELTLKCNMRCMHCGSSAGKKRKRELTTKQWNNVTKELVKLGCEKIAILGGEPFLRKDWYDISENIRQYDLKLLFISNGYLIKKNTIKLLRKLDPYAVAISIDGAKEETHDKIRQLQGSFEKCQDILKLLKSADLPTTVITTVNKLNFNELPDMREKLLNKGIAWQLQMAVPIGRFQKDFMIDIEEFYATAMFIATTRRNYSLKEIPIVGAHCFGYFSMVLPNYAIMPNWNGCQAGVTAIGIQSDGGVKGCLSLPGEFIQGNVIEKNLSEIWNDQEFCSFTRDFNIESLNGDCIGCKFGKKCKGGCLATSYSLTTLKFSDPYCLRLIEKKFNEKQ
jgi:radical SAM protein with 4Fe4S-binding SPASM domain